MRSERDGALRGRQRSLDRKQALGSPGPSRSWGVTWFEEPVSSDDLEGLRLLRDSAPPRMEITAGEYGYDPSTSGGCSGQERWTCCRRTLRAAQESQGFMAVGACATPAASPPQPIARRRCMSTRRAAPSVRHIEYFPTTCASSACCSKARRAPRGGRLDPDLVALWDRAQAQVRGRRSLPGGAKRVRGRAEDGRPTDFRDTDTEAAALRRSPERRPPDRAKIGGADVDRQALFAAFCRAR